MFTLSFIFVALYAPMRRITFLPCSSIVAIFTQSKAISAENCLRDLSQINMTDR